MIGLKRHTVRVVEHDPGWADFAADACGRVRRAGGHLLLDVQHVGSTSVRDLPAKPILDLAASVSSLDVVPDLVERLAPLGYVHRGCREHAGGHLFVWDSEPDVRAIHLHVVTGDDVQWKEYLRFRDLLRQDAALRRRYANLKLELALRFPHDRESYTAAKDDFIRGVLSGEAEREEGGTGEREGQAR